MELLNWGQRLLTTMTEVLDGERGVLGRDKSEKVQFDVRSDIETLLKSFQASKLRDNEKALAIFRKLAPFFAAGFFLEHVSRGSDGGASASDWLVSDVFLLGRHFKPHDASGAHKQPLPFAVPPLRTGQVVRGRGAAVIDGFHLEGMQNRRESSAYVIRLTSGSAFLLIDDRPALWRELMIETTYGVLTRLMDER